MRPVSFQLTEPQQATKEPKMAKEPHLSGKEVSVAPLDKRSMINAIQDLMRDLSMKIHSIDLKMTLLVRKAWVEMMTSKLLEVDTFSLILTN